jgi:hypothetical protein
VEPDWYPFILPVGLRGPDGVVHREGWMRRAFAEDEVGVLADPRVRNGDGWIVLLLLARVVGRLGSLEPVDPTTLLGLYASDFMFLQDLYATLNQAIPMTVEVSCGHCGRPVVATLGGGP